jgi:hypothetical protein
VRQGEGLNFRKQGGAVKLDVAMNPDGGANLLALNYVTSSGQQFFGIDSSKSF